MDVLITIFKFIIYTVLIFGFIWFTLYFRQKPYQALYLFISDLRRINPEHYPEYGFWLYSGLMGSGKTVSMTEYIIRMKEKYPKLYVVGNFTHSYIDKSFTTWQEIADITNPLGAEYGTLICFDEIHLTFQSDNWKSAPDNLLEHISMGRKNHRHIIASSQVFTRVNKKLREQTNYVIECNTYLNRWTFNKAFLTEEYMVNAELMDKGMRKRNRAWRYNFVQTKKIRDSFDTYELLSKLEPKKDLISVKDLVDSIDEFSSR